MPLLLVSQSGAPKHRSPLTRGFYEAEFVKTRCENSFFLFLIHFGRRLATTHLLGFGA